MASINDWINAATNIKNKTYNDYVNNNQGIINSINQQKDAELKSLENSNQQTISQLNDNKETINQTALDNAKQANINRLLAIKDNKGAMSRAGLSSQGLVGSQVNSINNNYGSNLNTILKDKASGLRDVDKQITNANLTYDTNKQNLFAQYAKTLSEQQASINNAATQLGLQAYNDYISQQQAYANYEQAKADAERNYQLQLRSLNSSSFGNYDSGKYAVNTAYYQGDLNSDAQYGTFSNGYQPDNIGGQKLKDSGKKMKITTTDRYGKTQKLTQTVWKTADGRKWYWDGRYNKYFQYK